MRISEKILILVVAICVSILGFNLIASSSVDLLKIARAAGYEHIHSYQVKCDFHNSQRKYVTQKASQLDQPNTSLQLTHAKTSLLQENSIDCSR